MVTTATFRTRFPEFSDLTDYPDARIQLFLDDAGLIVLESKFNTLTDIATSYLAAHYLAVGDNTAAGDTSSGGSITARAVGSVSESFGSAPINNLADQLLSSTSYGLQYLRYRKLVGTGNVSSI